MKKNGQGMVCAGIMSGTSLDGIDVAVIRRSKAGVETLAFHSVPYAAEVRAALLGVSNCTTHTRDIARLHFLLGELYAAAFLQTCKKGKIAVEEVEVIGCHGQTIYHEGTPVEFLGKKIASTLQIGDGNVLAARTGRTVVSDFRPADIAAGGQGAPLVPFVDYLLFHDEDLTRVALNIGGIANITWLPAGAPPEKVVAFDTGPGNMVVDQLVAHYSGGSRGFDKDGAMAAEGLVHPEIVAELLTDEYFSRRPPKSAGREQYGAAFVDALIARGLSPEDTVATATYFTAAAIAEGIAQFADGEEEPPAEVIVAGGGVHNETLMRFLGAELPESEITRSDAHGVDADAKEAVAFAVLASETLKGQTSNLPSATGAKRAVVLGKVCRG
ncbi:anhydro-N-acetylmuramic acid kinase [uncultured Paludibaculum sp.]|uniref:anhydro-N-acetylmuramic acid kinase n=1 Tax=uncultured Paludibaculum sp. TaxID=1765020 RepID=UPI002AABAFFF|nr:anhydro-N-acetylmuramic acid kinase [uncultured Paludibaculum sp.]